MQAGGSHRSGFLVKLFHAIAGRILRGRRNSRRYAATIANSCPRSSSGRPFDSILSPIKASIVATFCAALAAGTLLNGRDTFNRRSSEKSAVSALPSTATQELLERGKTGVGDTQDMV